MTAASWCQVSTIWADAVHVARKTANSMMIQGFHNWDEPPPVFVHSWQSPAVLERVDQDSAELLDSCKRHAEEVSLRPT